MNTRKVGHAGTLDPMATGVLVAGINRGTKFLAHMVAATKTYKATVVLGASTTTDDAEGEVVATTSAEHLTPHTITDALDSFRGTIWQKPASVSAIKIDGKRAHERVRNGEKVDIPPREVTIYDLTVSDIRIGKRAEADFTVCCSSGTYIRSLARDLGQHLGVGGHLSYLRRTQVGPFSIEEAVTLDELEANPQLTMNLDEALVRCYPTAEVTKQEAANLAMGKWLQPRGLKGVHAAVAPDGRAIALVKESGSRLSTVFVARPATL